MSPYTEYVIDESLPNKWFKLVIGYIYIKSLFPIIKMEHNDINMNRNTKYKIT